MIYFNSNPNIKFFERNTCKINRSSKAYSFFLNEYRGIKTNDYDYLLSSHQKKRGIISSFIGDMLEDDSSIIVKPGTVGHMYFTSEFGHDFPEDKDHNLIISDDLDNVRIAK